MLDTIAQYPNDPTLGKLTFMIDLKNQQKDLNVADFNGVGKSKLTMSLGYKDGNYPSESQVPIYTSQDVTAKYAVKLRLKGELLVSIMCMRSWPACFSLIRLRISPKSLCVREV